MGFGDNLRRFFGDPNPNDYLVDVRNPAQRGLQNSLAGEYSRAQADPTYGGLSPADQRYMESELTRSIKNRTGASGAGGSGYEADLVRKAIVDFRIGQMAKRQNYLDSLRSGILSSGSLQATTPQPGLLSGAAQYGIGRGIAKSFDSGERDPGGSFPGNEENGRRPANGGFGVNGT